MELRSFVRADGALNHPAIVLALSTRDLLLLVLLFLFEKPERKRDTFVFYDGVFNVDFLNLKIVLVLLQKGRSLWKNLQRQKSKGDITPTVSKAWFVSL